MPHDEFIDGVVNEFLQQDIDSVVGVTSAAETPDVHTGSQADVLKGRKRLDLAFVVGNFSLPVHDLP